MEISDGQASNLTADQSGEKSS